MVSKRHIQPELSIENEQADAERDGRTLLARLNSQARTGTGKYLFFCVQLIRTRIGNLTRLIHILLYVMTILLYLPVEVLPNFAGFHNILALSS